MLGYKYKFKSVGKTFQKSFEEVVEISVPPIGIRTPMQLDETGSGLLLMNYGNVEQIADNLRNLLMTNHGERLGLYRFGANLRPLTTDYSSREDFDGEAINRIRNAVSTWMPYIELEDFESNFDRYNNVSTAIINIRITYNIPSINAFNQKIQVNLYVI